MTTANDQSPRAAGIEGALRRVWALKADTSLLRHRVDEAADYATRGDTDELARLYVARAEGLRFRPDLALPILFQLLDGTTKDADVVRWAACFLTTLLAQLGETERAAALVDSLRQRFSRSDADIEHARLVVAEESPMRDLSHVLASYQEATRSRLAYGSYWAEVDSARLAIDGRLGADVDRPMSSVLATNADRYRHAGFVDVADHADLVTWRARRLEGEAAKELVDDAQALLTAAENSGDLTFRADVVLSIAPVLHKAGAPAQVQDLLVEGCVSARWYPRIREHFLSLLHDFGDIEAARTALAEAADERVVPSQEIDVVIGNVNPNPPENKQLAPGITNTEGWSDEQVAEELEEVKKKLDWENTTGSSRKWWDAFENENRHRLALVLRVAEELANRQATITEFFLAYLYSNTDNIQANLFYLEFQRLKKQSEAWRKERKTEIDNWNGFQVPEYATDVSGWTQQAISDRLEGVKEKLDWQNTTGSAEKFWQALEAENSRQMDRVLHLAEHLKHRDATVTEFFLAFVYSNTSVYYANLYYLDYTRLKKEEERKKRESASKARPKRRGPGEEEGHHD